MMPISKFYTVMVHNTVRNIFKSCVQVFCGFVAHGLFLLMHYGYAAAQDVPMNIRFRNIGIEQGLSQSSIYGIAQDKYGFLWFATQDGLNRYDGYSFKVFRNNPDDSTSLSQNWVTSVYYTPSGRLWVSTPDALNLFHPATETFTTFKHDPKQPNTLSSRRVVCMREDKHGNLWIGTMNGLSCYITTTATMHTWKELKEFTDASRTAPIHIGQVYALQQDSTGTLWAGTDSGLFAVSDIVNSNALHEASPFVRRVYSKPVYALAVVSGVRTSGAFASGIVLAGTNEGLLVLNGASDTQEAMYDAARVLPPTLRANNSVIGITHVSNGDVWLRMKQGLVRFSIKTTTMEGFFATDNKTDSTALLSNDVTVILEDRDSVLWVGTNSGLCIFKPTTRNFVQYKHSPLNIYSIAYNRIRSLYQDHSGTVWVGTDVGGLSNYSRIRQKFIGTNVWLQYVQLLQNLSVRAFLTDEYGGVWVGTDTGLRFFHLPNGMPLPRGYAAIPKLLPLTSVGTWSLFKDNHNRLWIGTFSEGIIRFDLNTGEVRRFTHNPLDSSSVAANRIRHIIQDRSGTIWVAAFVMSSDIAAGRLTGGLCKFDEQKQVFVRYQANPQNPHALSDNLVRYIFQDSQNRLWVGTNGGLNLFDPVTERFTKYFYVPEDHKSLSNNTVSCIHESRAGELWFATASGLNRFDRTTKTFKRYTMKQGLPNDFVYGVLEDTQGNLWLSTNRGIAVFNPRTEIFRNFDAGDGLQSDEFNAGAFYKSPSGLMFFGGVKGMNIFAPENIASNTIPPLVRLVTFNIDNKPRLWEKPLQELEHITLRYDESSFSCEFAALDYTNPLKNQYAYNLEGVDKDWVYAGSRRFVSYSDVEPGEYVLRVKATNSDGVWNEEGVRLHITITPPVWKTWWFRLLAGVALCCLIFVLYKARVRAIERQNRRLARLVEERTRDLEASVEELRRADEEIRRQNTILQEQTVQIELNNAELQEKNMEFRTLNYHLEESNQEIFRYNQILEEQAQEIEIVNTELQERNMQLGDANGQLQQLNQRKNELLGIVAHDLKNPLSAIIMAGSMIERYFEKMTKEKLLSSLAGIQTTAERMNTIITDLLNVEAIETGAMQLKANTINMSAIVRRVVQEYETKASAKTIALHLQEQQVDMQGFADENAVWQVLDNLVSNAIKYSPPDKNVWVSITNSQSMLISNQLLRTQSGANHALPGNDSFVIVSVRDEGPGFSEQDKEKLFGRFVKLSARPTAGESSTGLGLSIVKYLVESMGGRVWLESEQGCGATFYVQIPVAPSEYSQ